MPFTPLRLLLTYDPAFGHCGAVVPKMKQMLEDRAFEVEVLVLGDSETDVDLGGFDGLVLGDPVSGSGLRSGGVGPRVQRFVKDLGDLDEVRVALFSVFTLRAGDTLEALQKLVESSGGEVVVSQALSRLAPARNEHVLPAECMVRIR